MIATSEVAISLTIDDTCHLEDIKKDLTKYGTIEVEESLSIICIVGDCSINNNGLAARALTALEDIPLHMISYGRQRTQYIPTRKTGGQTKST